MAVLALVGAALPLRYSVGAFSTCIAENSAGAGPPHMCAKAGAVPLISYAVWHGQAREQDVQVRRRSSMSEQLCTLCKLVSFPDVPQSVTPCKPWQALRPPRPVD